jgi:hypothetical protein
LAGKNRQLAGGDENVQRTGDGRQRVHPAQLDHRQADISIACLSVPYVLVL